VKRVHTGQPRRRYRDIRAFGKDYENLFLNVAKGTLVELVESELSFEELRRIRLNATFGSLTVRGRKSF